MKKPVLLLVDDDPAVLAALDAELGPHFESVMRIECFDSADAVLDALPGWEAEERAIAVAVVDERMPGRSGVDLLRALRATAEGVATHPAAHAQGVLLTGYAGLESAMAAKNETAIHRYLEKPWSADEVREAVRSAFARYVARSGRGAYASLKQLSTEAEIRAALALRFAVYQDTSAMTGFLPVSRDDQLDVDEFDLVAEQFGLVRVDSEVHELVGTLRIAGQEPSSAALALQAVVPRGPLRERMQAQRKAALPLLKYLVDGPAVEALLDRARAAGERFVEPGRLTVAPAVRGAVAGQERHLARLVFDGAVGHAFYRHGIENALLTCIPAHALFYRPYGFRETSGTAIRHHASVNIEIGCYHGRIEWVPEPARARCSAIAQRQERTGETCRCAVFPACLGGPYETGRFESVDLFCPVAASEVIAPRAKKSAGGSSDVP